MTTFNFDREYLKNKNGKQTSPRAIPAALNKKIGKLLCTNKKVINVDVDPPKINCARDFEQL